MNSEILQETIESLKRPAWTSTVETGNFEAYKHKHIYSKSIVILENHYEKTKGEI